MRDDIRRGMQAHLRALRAAEAAGDTCIGWKIGFNDPAVQGRMGLDETLVGHLLASRTAEPGGSWSLPPGDRSMLEVEIAIELARDVPPGGSLDTARSAIARLLPALELVDFNRSFDDVETILSHDIFHEAVVFGGVESGRTGASLDAVTAQASLDGELVAEGDLTLVPADLAEVVRHVADTLGALDEPLRTGHRIIAGSLVKPIPVHPGSHIHANLGPLGSLSLDAA